MSGKRQNIERRQIPPEERAQQVARMWDEGALLSELVLHFRYSPATILMDLVLAKWPEQADKRRAYAAYDAIKFGLFGYDPRKGPQSGPEDA